MRDFDPTASEYISSGYIERSKPGGVLYDFGSIIGAVAGPVIGGLMGSDSAGDAAAAQQQAAAQSDATQRYFYDTTRADNAPFRETGLAANNRLAQLMGLSGGSGKTREQLRAELLGSYTRNGSGGGSANALMGQPAAQRTPVYSPFRQGNSDDGNWGGEIIGYTDGGSGGSYIDESGLNSEVDRQFADQTARQQAAERDPAFGSLMRNFTMADRDADPVYQSGLQFGLSEGTKGINRQAAASGSMLSGATLKALTRFGNDYGSTKANESYNRFNNNQTQQYNRLAGISGAGQQATNQVSAAGQNAGNQISASQQGAGNARASGYLAQGNAMQNAVNGGISAWNNRPGGNALNNYGGFGMGGGGGFGSGSGFGNQDLGGYL